MWSRLTTNRGRHGLDIALHLCQISAALRSPWDQSDVAKTRRTSVGEPASPADRVLVESPSFHRSAPQALATAGPSAGIGVPNVALRPSPRRTATHRHKKCGSRARDPHSRVQPKRWAAAEHSETVAQGSELVERWRRRLEFRRGGRSRPSRRCGPRASTIALKANIRTRCGQSSPKP